MQITQLLQRIHSGEREVMHCIIPLVYEEMKRLARSHLRRETKGAPLDTTALVHEVFLKLSKDQQPRYENRSHFFGIVSRLMRQVLVDMARARTAEKRGRDQEILVADLPDWGPQPDRVLLALEEALQQLEQEHPLKGQMIEMKYFGGLTAEETAIALSMPVHVVRRELRLAQAWLRFQMGEPSRK